MEYAIRLFFILFFSLKGLMVPLGLGLVAGLVSGYFIGAWAFAFGVGVFLTVRIIQGISAMSHPG